MHDSVERLVGVAILGALFVGLMVHYGAAAPDHELTRQSVAKLETPGSHVGEPVYFWATVEDVGDGLAVRAGGQHLTVVGADVAAEPGDPVQISGTVRPGGSVAAERVVVSERSRLAGLYAVSAVALAIALVVFGRHWRVDLRRLAVVARGGGEDA